MSNSYTIPISGDLKIPLLIMEWLIVLAFVELALILLIKVIKEEVPIRVYQEKASMFIFLGFAVMNFCFIIADYYNNDLWMWRIYLNFGYFLAGISMLFFFFFIEKYQIFYKKYLFTILQSIVIISFIFYAFLDPYYAFYITYLMWMLFIIFFFSYLEKLRLSFYKRAILKKYFRQFITLLLGSFFLILGYILSTFFTRALLGLKARFYGDIFQLIASFFLGYFVISLSSFSEFNWQNRINSIYIMHKSGLFIYKKNYLDGHEMDLDSTVLTGTLANLKIMLDKATDHTGISIIESEGRIIIIHPGTHIIGVLICNEKLKSLQILLKSIIEKIERIYSSILIKWDGDLRVFDPIEGIVKEIFF